MTKDISSQRADNTLGTLPEQSKSRDHALDLTGPQRGSGIFPAGLETTFPRTFAGAIEDTGARKPAGPNDAAYTKRDQAQQKQPIAADRTFSKNVSQPSSDKIETILDLTSSANPKSAKQQEPYTEPVSPPRISRGLNGWSTTRLIDLITAYKIKNEWLPDIQAAAPTHLQIQNEHQREMLRFSNSIANTGANNLQVRRGTPLDPSNANDQALIDYAQALGLNPTKVAVTTQELLDENGQIAAVVNDAALSEYHPEHKHFHIGETAGFTLERFNAGGDGSEDDRWDPITGYEVTKTTFCLIDVNRIEQVEGNQYEIVNSPAKDNLYNDCFADVQGIQDGWIDRYSHSLPGQEVDITGLDPGVYRIVVTVNPSNWFIESNFDNNTGWTAFELTRASNGNASLNELTGIGMVGGLWFDQSPNGMG